MERPFCVCRNCIRCCDFGVAASDVYALNVEGIASDVLCCQGSCYGAFPLWEGSEVDLLVCEDESGRRFLWIVGEDDDESGNQ